MRCAPTSSSAGRAGGPFEGGHPAVYNFVHTYQNYSPALEIREAYVNVLLDRPTCARRPDGGVGRARRRPADRRHQPARPPRPDRLRLRGAKDRGRAGPPRHLVPARRAAPST
jgi:hypothetical protein